MAIRTVGWQQEGGVWFEACLGVEPSINLGGGGGGGGEASLVPTFNYTLEFALLHYSFSHLIRRLFSIAMHLLLCSKHHRRSETKALHWILSASQIELPTEVADFSDTCRTFMSCINNSQVQPDRSHRPPLTSTMIQIKKLINVYRQPQPILLLPSTHATCFVHYWPSSGFYLLTYSTEQSPS